MKLGTQTASLVNHLHSRGVIGQPEPEIGMGCTILGWTDRYPGTIVEIFQIGKNVAIRVQRDDYKLIGGSIMSESQQYEFTPNPNAGTVVYMRDQTGRWHEMTRKVMEYSQKPHIVRGQTTMRIKTVLSRRWSKSNGHGLRIGERDAYRDPCF